MNIIYICRDRFGRGSKAPKEPPVGLVGKNF